MQLDFDKMGGLIPAVIQDSRTRQVLMLGYMNQEALDQTIEKNLVCFYSRSKKRLWTKGETSGNFLQLVKMHVDCDNDSLLIQVIPKGPACHKGTVSCFETDCEDGKGFITQLEEILEDRIKTFDEGSSYTSKMFKKGPKAIAQKVGEEAVELILEAENGQLEDFENESADLMYHFLLLLKSRGRSFGSIERCLYNRSQLKSSSTK